MDWAMVFCDRTLTLISMPFIGAIIGWGTNYLAIKMLFRPRRPWKFGYLSIQGVFPRRQLALADKIGEVVASELVSAEDLRDALKASAQAPEVLEALERNVKAAVVDKVRELLPVFGGVVGENLGEGLRQLFRERFYGASGEIVAAVEQRLEEHLDFRAIVRDKVANFSSERLEALIFQIMRRELRFVEYVGGLLGFLVGLFQVLIYGDLF